MKDVLKPQNDTGSSIESLLASALELTPDDAKSISKEAEQGMDECRDTSSSKHSGSIASHGFWRRSEDVVLGVVVDDGTIQKFRQTRTRYLLAGLPEDASDWELVQVIPEENYHCVQKHHAVYLFST